MKPVRNVLLKGSVILPAAGLSALLSTVALRPPASAAEKPVVNNFPAAQGSRLKSLRRSDGALAEARATVPRGQYIRFFLTNMSLARIAVADTEIAEAETINDQEILILGKSAGSTTVVFWFRNGTSEMLLLSVQRDLTTLANALQNIHASLTVEGAPDRDALVLRGRVPDITYSHAAEAAARSYLSSGGMSGRTAAPLVRDPEKSKPAAKTAETARSTGEVDDDDPAETTVRTEGKLASSEVAVINLIRLDKLPPALEERLAAAVKPVGGEQISVRRISRGSLNSDQDDVLVLEGKVPNQVALTRVLSTAARFLTKGRVDISVLADEAGGLGAARSAASGGGGGGLVGFGGQGGTSGGGISSRSGNLSNQLNRNIGRARALSVANGRILSFIEVVDLPQIRVGVKLYEINRNRLQAYTADIIGILSDFRQPRLLPAVSAVTAQGAQAARVGSFGNDVQQVVHFLNGALSGQTQLVAGNFALDVLLSLLESKGIARRLSSPSLSVLNGELAQFQVGGEVPVSTTFAPAFGGGQQNVVPGVFATVNFVSFGVQLGVRPLVNEHDTLTIDLSPQVVQPDAALTTAVRETSGTNQPTTAFQTRFLRTTAQLQDGQSLLVGGLTTRQTDRADTGTPILNKIPWVGNLFQAFSDSSTEFELLVLVNPVIVRTPSPDFALWEFPSASQPKIP